VPRVNVLLRAGCLLVGVVLFSALYVVLYEANVAIGLWTYLVGGIGGGLVLMAVMNLPTRNHRRGPVPTMGSGDLPAR
jgi:hypothetical protein